MSKPVESVGDSDWDLLFRVVTRAEPLGQVAVSLVIQDGTGFTVLNGTTGWRHARELAFELLVMSVWAETDEAFIQNRLARGDPWERVVHDLGGLRRHRQHGREPPGS
jgi:hypothetical protein